MKYISTPRKVKKGTGYPDKRKEQRNPREQRARRRLFHIYNKYASKALNWGFVIPMLGRAHWLHREADRATRRGNFHAALGHHREAAETLQKLLLAQALQDKVRRSVKLQVRIVQRIRH